MYLYAKIQVNIKIINVWFFRYYNVEIALNISSTLCNLRLLNIDVENDAKDTRMFNFKLKKPT